MTAGGVPNSEGLGVAVGVPPFRDSCGVGTHVAANAGDFFKVTSAVGAHLTSAATQADAHSR